MTNNPLDVFRNGSPAGKTTVADLHGYALSLNGQRWVIDSGLPYFVNVHTQSDGSPRHYLDRRTSKEAEALSRRAAA